MSLLVGSYLATGIFNLDSSRFVAAPRDTRSEGWTEAWGANESEVQDPTHWQLDEGAVSSILATEYPQLPLVLSQFRPAWLEQLVLRMAGVPHIVLNSAHCASEATGPLPFLRDHSEPTKPPVLVGQHHPSNIVPPNPLGHNYILEYLKSHRGVDLDKSLETEEQRSLSLCFFKLIQLELNPILTYLRYEDFSAWEQVYRRQYLMASSPDSENWISHLKGRFQAALERLSARRRMAEYSRFTSVQKAVNQARDAYQALEFQLIKHGKEFLLGNDSGKPSLVDAILWAHLADALCDVHLVIVLADFPHLVKYFRNIYKRYFTETREEWDKWNQTQNLANAFQKELPLFNQKVKLAASGFQDAIELMQSLSLRNQSLQDVLDTAKAKRSTENWPTPTPKTETLLYRWTMGEKLLRNKAKEDVKADDPNENPVRKKMIQEQTRNDQIWLSGVAGVSAIAILLLQGAVSSGEAS